MTDYINPRSLVEYPQTQLRKAVDTILQQMADAGYCAGVIKYYRYSYRRILAFAENQGITAYSPAFGNTFLRAFARDISKRPVHTKTLLCKARKALQKLHDFTLYHRWSADAIKVPTMDVPAAFADDFHAFLEYWETERCVAAKTLANSKRYIPRFLRFLDQCSIQQWSGLYPAVFSEFFTTFPIWSPRSLDSLTAYIRLFMRFLFMRGMTSTNWEKFIPSFRPFADQRLPQVWPRGTVDKILSVIDRSTVQGKRDYAILSLAYRLGLRAGDIRALQLEHLRWQESHIEFVQHKTGRRLVLPITEEVGTALIDYLKNGRPVTEYREVFLRVIAPHRPFKQLSLYNQLERYRRLAGVTLPDGAARGLHSLRHTLASELQAAEVPLETIAEILGHVSMDSTRIYARVDLEQLRTAALDPEEVSYA